MDKIKNSIYIDLDSLLDTRFSLLTEMSPKIAGEVLLNKQYFNRLRDSFPPIPEIVFKTFYKYRDNSLLKTAIRTHITDVLFSEVCYVELNPQIKEGVKVANIVINTYPYRLTKKEIDDIKKSIRFTMGNIDFNIKDTYFNPYNVSLTDFKEFYSIIMYDGLNWLKYRIATNEFFNFNMPSTRLYIPAFLEKIEKNKNIEDIFKDMKRSMEYFIDLQFTPVKMFSLKHE